jgi:formamidopyrimidine-DNA glycosylase
VVDAIHRCCEEGLAFEREQANMSSSKERPAAMHNRTGLPCPDCQDTVREVSYSRYTVNYCPTCQTEGKVLADNTTSKFLK